MKKHFLLLSILILFFITCSRPENSIDFQSFNYSYQNQKFSVVPAYLNMKLFADEAKKQPAQINRLYDRFVYQSIFRSFVAKGKYPEVMETLKPPITDIVALQEEIVLLKNSNLPPFVFEQLKTISDSLSGPDTNIILLAMNPGTKVIFKQYDLDWFYQGVTAFATGTGNIIISIDPREENWQTILKHIIAHEYHHNVWSSRHFERKDFSVIEYLVFEGRADYFASRIFPEVNSRWLRHQSPQKEKEAWSILKNNLKLRSFDLDKIFYSDWNLPYGVVYATGFSIVSNFMKNNPQVNLVELTNLNPQEILDSSGHQCYIDSIE
jgi:uncharacterized protein YjaZ